MVRIREAYLLPRTESNGHISIEIGFSAKVCSRSRLLLSRGVVENRNIFSHYQSNFITEFVLNELEENVYTEMSARVMSAGATKKLSQTSLLSLRNHTHTSSPSTTFLILT